MTSTLRDKYRQEITILLGLLVLCLTLRIGVLNRYWSDLNDDRDAYLSIAQSLQAGNGYSTFGSDSPTAFRPPLYPLVITPFAQPHQNLGRGLINLLFASGTLVLIWMTGQHLGLSIRAKTIGGLFYCLDPLLLRYTAFPMTETLCTFLISLLLWRLTEPKSSLKCAFFSGIVFGLCVLCRPTIWAFGGLYFLFWAVFLRQNGLNSRKWNTQVLSATTLGILCLVLPWTVRNWVQLGTPVVMTTHGGYTVLLGNNERFYEEVVQQPWGTVWDGSHGGGQAVWVTDLNQQMEDLNLKGEVERDRWMSAQARKTIYEHPTLFLKACLLRVVRFWNIMPSGPALESVSPVIVWGTAVFYVVLWCFLLIGIVVVLSKKAMHHQWAPLLLLMIALTGVHTIYWSNARMRAPVMPAIVLLAAIPFSNSSKSHFKTQEK